jgi:hypothetical protein
VAERLKAHAWRTSAAPSESRRHVGNALTGSVIWRVAIRAWRFPQGSIDTRIDVGGGAELEVE